MKSLHQLAFWAKAKQPNNSQNSTSPAPSAGPTFQNTPPRTIEELEQRMAREMARESVLEAEVLHSRPTLSVKLRRTWNRLVWTAILLGIPIGALAVVNLPYAPIRDPIAEEAPLLLLPSYISMDRNFRQASAALEAASQLIDQATAPSDLDQGEEKLKQAKASLDRLPTWVWSELPDTPYLSWYDWRLNPLGLNRARAEVGRLEAKLFQEKNAQTALAQAEQTLGAAMQQHQEAATSPEKQAALRVWQDALDQLQQIPDTTLAGRSAQQKLEAAQREFEAKGGLQTQESISLIEAAKDFAWQAANASQKPPHSVDHWQKVINLWKLAISRLEQVSRRDLAGYREAQKLLATYTTDLEIIKVRQQEEADATWAMQQAKAQIADLIKATSPDLQQFDRSYVVGQLQHIVNQLESVKPGTTAYQEAQQLLKSARAKLKQLQ